MYCNPTQKILQFYKSFRYYDTDIVTAVHIYLTVYPTLFDSDIYILLTSTDLNMAYVTFHKFLNTQLKMTRFDQQDILIYRYKVCHQSRIQIDLLYKYYH